MEESDGTIGETGSVVPLLQRRMRGKKRLLGSEKRHGLWRGNAVMRGQAFAPPGMRLCAWRRRRWSLSRKQCTSSTTGGGNHGR